MKRIPKALRKFLLGYLLLHLVATVLVIWILSSLIGNQMREDARARMLGMSRVLSQQIVEMEDGIHSPELPAHVEAVGARTGYRFTIVAPSGEVLADSDTGDRDIGNHGSRAEILQARDEGTGFSERYSRTLQRPMIYVADRAPTSPNAKRDGEPPGVIRVAAPAESIRAAVRSVQTSIWLFALAVSLLTGFTMVFFATRTLQPLQQFADAARRIGLGNYDAAPSLLGRRDEWGLLAVAFRKMQRELESREQTMLENSVRLEAVLSSMIEGVVAVAPDDTVMLANDAACRMLDIEQRDLLGRKLLEVVRIPELSQAVERTRAQRTFSESEFHTLSPSRRILRARVSVLVRQIQVDDEDGPGITIVLHDVTDLRQLENMRRDFVANVSHELKTPLSSIIAYAETLRLGAINDQQKNLLFVEQIETQAQVLNQQIQDLLQLARVESGQAIWNFSAVDVNQVCETAIDLLLSEAENQNIHLQFRPAPDPPYARADANGLRTIVTNLVSNAIHYTPSGGSVTVLTHTDDHSAIVTVKDTGIGIAREHQSRIFERFYRVDKARSRDLGGTGLGLSIVKHITQSFGGSVELESQVGRGSTFRVRLPRQDV